MACQVGNSFNLGQKLAHAQRIAAVVRGPSPRRSGSDLAWKGSGSHLALGHTKDSVVDEDDSDVFGAGSGVNDFGKADGSEVAVALVSEDDRVRANTLKARGYGGSASVSGLNRIAIEIFIRIHRASNAGDGHGALANFQLIQDLSDKAVSGAVGT
jgi:hypothetical protein